MTFQKQANRTKLLLVA